MVVAEDEESLITHYSVAFLKDSFQLLRKPVGVGVLHLLRTPCRTIRSALFGKIEFLPCMEEVSQFGVVNVIEERRIGDYDMHALVGQIGACRVSAREIRRSRRQPTLRVRIQHGGPHGRTHAEYLASRIAGTMALHGNLEWSVPVVQRPDESTLVESRKRAGTLWRPPQVSFNWCTLRFQYVMRMEDIRQAQR